MWCAHRVLWDAVDVQLAPGTAWTRAQVIDAMLDRFVARREYERASDWRVERATRRSVDELGAALAAACTNVDAVEREIVSLLTCPRRSSSMVEAFNNILRVLQQAHRHVSDDLLAILALKWNLSPRREGPRRGRSPYVLLPYSFHRFEDLKLRTSEASSNRWRRRWTRSRSGIRDAM